MCIHLLYTQSTQRFGWNGKNWGTPQQCAKDSEGQPKQMVHSPEILASHPRMVFLFFSAGLFLDRLSESQGETNWLVTDLFKFC